MDANNIIRQARLAHGFSQQYMAIALGIHLRQYQRLEYGESDVWRMPLRSGLIMCQLD